MASVTETAKSAGRLVRHAIGAALSPLRAGEEKVALHAGDLRTGQMLLVESDAFDDGEPIPQRFSAEEGGANVSPALRWTGAPAGTVSFVVIVEDPDAPMKQPFIHWLAWNFRADATQLPAAVPTTPSLGEFPGAVQGRNDAKKVGYYGPLPPRGHGLHHYHFQVFALNSRLHLSDGADRDALVAAMKGHVLAMGEMIGTYERI